MWDDNELPCVAQQRMTTESTVAEEKKSFFALFCQAKKTRYSKTHLSRWVIYTLASFTLSLRLDLTYAEIDRPRKKHIMYQFNNLRND
jgi:hypothetical protein